MALPLGAGRLQRQPGKSITQLASEQLQITSWHDVAERLSPGRPNASVQAAIRFYQNTLVREFSNRPLSAFAELLAIDFDKPVLAGQLVPGQKVLTYCKTAPVLGTSRPNEGRVRLGADGAPRTLLLGAFLSEVGTAPQRLGIATGGRRGVQLKVLQIVPMLRSCASGVVDVWTDRPAWSNAEGTLRLASGGGVQFRVPREHVDDAHFAIL
ncbi:MAG: hypothetical protein JRG76_10470 [Deltaproteobacteria bacterium]|nr:hypothetical protein [Deltaproteobacteria bacterium]MBW2414921.1 hypothetical protein [Deltaproteobacteria bacterium]